MARDCGDGYVAKVSRGEVSDKMDYSHIATKYCTLRAAAKDGCEWAFFSDADAMIVSPEVPLETFVKNDEDAVWSLPSYKGEKCGEALEDGCVSPEFMGACVNTGAYLLHLHSNLADAFIDGNLGLEWKDLEGFSTAFDFGGSTMPEQCALPENLEENLVGDQCALAFLFHQHPEWFGKVTCVGASAAPLLEDSTASGAPLNAAACASATLADLQQVSTHLGSNCPFVINAVRGRDADVAADKFGDIVARVAEYGVLVPESREETHASPCQRGNCAHDDDDGKKPSTPAPAPGRSGEETHASPCQRGNCAHDDDDGKKPSTPAPSLRRPGR